MKIKIELIFWSLLNKIVDKTINILRWLHIMKPLPKINMPDELEIKRDGQNIYVCDCPFKIMKETKHNIILYNEINNNLIITDNYNYTFNDITDIFIDVRFYSLYYKVMTASNLVIVIRSDEGLTNDYHVFEKMDVSNIISNKVSFKSVFNSLSGKKSYFLS